MKKYQLAVLVCAFLISACGEIEDCQLSPYSDSVQVSMNHNQLIIFDSVRVNETLDLELDTLNSFGLPLDLTQEKVNYTFYTDSMSYLLELSYKNEIRIFDVNCDPVIRFYDLEIQRTNFDSVVLIGSEINLNFFPINIEIYF
jgi:hypothetical protein